MSIYCNISKKLGNFHLEAEFSGGNEVLSLLGASGSGKSMILRCIAGIETPDTGILKVDDRVLFDKAKGINLHPRERNVGFLLQDYGLFPHMTVRGNLEIVAKANKCSVFAVEELLQMFDLEAQQQQYPSQLSGGQKQRCAIARILLKSPDIMLLDEPFSALDSFLRQRLEGELFGYLKDYKKTVVFVSHNREEVYRHSEKISVITKGKTSPMRDKASLFTAPEAKETAVLIGCENIFSLKEFPELPVFFQEHSSFHWEEKLITGEYVGFFAQSFLYGEDIPVGDYIVFDFRIVESWEGVFTVTYGVQPIHCPVVFRVELEKTIDVQEGKLYLPWEKISFLQER